MKKTIKLVLALMTGVIIGMGGSIVCIGLFSDMTVAEFMEKLKGIAVLELLGVMAFS